jgi:hypothetical protein
MTLKPSAAPFSNQVWIASHLLRRAGEHPMAARAGKALDQLANGRSLAIDDVEHHLEAAAHAEIAVRPRKVAGEWGLEIVAGEVQADHSLELGEREGRLDQRVHVFLDPPCLGFGRADERADARQHLDVIGDCGPVQPLAA